MFSGVSPPSRCCVGVIARQKNPVTLGGRAWELLESEEAWEITSCRHCMRRDVSPTLWVAATTTDRTTHRRGLHVSGQPRTAAGACQPVSFLPHPLSPSPPLHRVERG